MIEPTDEMVYAFAGEPEITGTDAHAISVGLAAVLAIVERDWNMQPRPDGSRLPPSRCGARGFAVGPGCIRRAGHEGGHGYSDGSGEQDKP